MKRALVIGFLLLSLAAAAGALDVPTIPAPAQRVNATTRVAATRRRPRRPARRRRHPTRPAHRRHRARTRPPAVTG